MLTTKVTESLQNCAMKLAVDSGGHDDVSESLCSDSDLSTQMDYYFAPYKEYNSVVWTCDLVPHGTADQC